MNKELELVNIKLSKCIKDDLDDKIFITHRELLSLKQALTPPTADEIVKELNEEYGVDDFKLVWNGTHTILSFYSAKAPCDINCNVLSEDKSLMVGANWSEEPMPLKLAHKITSFFMEAQNEK